VEWNETKHATLLSRLAETGHRTSDGGRLPRARGSPEAGPQMDFFVAPSAPAVVAVPVNPSTQPLNERYTFDTFVIGKSNELAAAAAHAAGRIPRQDLQSLFIYGATGPRQDPPHAGHRPHGLPPPARHAVCSTWGAEQFINEVIESIHSRTMPEFRRRYRADVDLSWWPRPFSSKARR